MAHRASATPGTRRHPPRRLAVFTPQLNLHGGTERATWELIRRFAVNRPVVVYTMQSEVETIDNVEIVTLRRLPGPQLVAWSTFLVRSAVIAARIRRGSEGAIVFSPGVNLLGADVTVAHVDYREYTRRLAKDPLPKSSPFASRRSRLRLFHSWLYAYTVMAAERAHYRRSRFVFAVSEKTRRSLESRGIEVVGVAPNGVDLTAFRRQQPREPAVPASLLTIGSEVPVKGLDLLISAVSSISLRDQVTLTVVTREENVDLLNEAARRLGYHGLTTVTAGVESEGLFNGFDLYVAPSRYDSFNMPSLEAMASGMPVILSKECGFADWVERDEAILVEANVSALEAAIADLIVAPEIREAMSDKGYRLAQRMTWDVPFEAVRAAVDSIDVM